MLKRCPASTLGGHRSQVAANSRGYTFFLARAPRHCMGEEADMDSCVFPVAGGSRKEGGSLATVFRSCHSAVGPPSWPCPDPCFLCSFVFLQLYHSPFFGDESNKPILLPNEVGCPSLCHRRGGVTEALAPHGSRLCSTWVGAIILRTGAMWAIWVGGWWQGSLCPELT